MACSRAPEPRTRIFTGPAYRGAGCSPGRGLRLPVVAATSPIRHEGVGSAGRATVEPCPAGSRPTKAVPPSRPCAPHGKRRPQRPRDLGALPAAAAGREVLRGTASRCACPRSGPCRSSKAPGTRAGLLPTSSRPMRRRGSPSRSARRNGRMPPPPAASGHRASEPTSRTFCRCGPEPPWLRAASAGSLSLSKRAAPGGDRRWDNGCMGPHIDDRVERVRVRRAPKFSVFLLAGAALGIIVALILTFAFSGTEADQPQHRPRLHAGPGLRIPGAHLHHGRRRARHRGRADPRPAFIAQDPRGPGRPPEGASRGLTLPSRRSRPGEAPTRARR